MLRTIAYNQPLNPFRPVKGDEIVTGVGSSNILQRFKLVSKVALITGGLRKAKRGTGFAIRASAYEAAI